MVVKSSLDLVWISLFFSFTFLRYALLSWSYYCTAVCFLCQVLWKLEGEDIVHMWYYSHQYPFTLLVRSFTAAGLISCLMIHAGSLLHRVYLHAIYVPIHTVWKSHCQCVVSAIHCLKKLPLESTVISSTTSCSEGLESFMNVSFGILYIYIYLGGSTICYNSYFCQFCFSCLWNVRNKRIYGTCLAL